MSYGDFVVFHIKKNKKIYFWGLPWENLRLPTEPEFQFFPSYFHNSDLRYYNLLTDCTVPTLLKSCCFVVFVIFVVGGVFVVFVVFSLLVFLVFFCFMVLLVFLMFFGVIGVFAFFGVFGVFLVFLVFFGVFGFFLVLFWCFFGALA